MTEEVRVSPEETIPSVERRGTKTSLGAFAGGTYPNKHKAWANLVTQGDLVNGDQGRQRSRLQGTATVLKLKAVPCDSQGSAG